jgi:hypothetical protein
VKKIKASFAKVGAYSAEENFIRGDPEGVVEWISGEAETFKEILSDRGDVCAFSDARGIPTILEKAGCVAEPPELFQLKCLSHASRAVTHLNRNNPSVPQI